MGSNLMDGLNSRVEMTEDKICELEDKSIAFIQFRQQKIENRKKKKSPGDVNKKVCIQIKNSLK